jgi:3',5'-cyclic AMP phosphodiesterase CpdA
MGWAGGGLLWSLGGGVAGSAMLGEAQAAPANAFSFVQVSDSHIGFSKDPNPDARATFREAAAKIASLPQKPAFILHTGDVSHLSRPEEFDDAVEILKGAGLSVFWIPGEHDMLDEGGGRAFLDRFGQGAQGDGWYSFDRSGVHFIGLVNVRQLQAGGMGHLGAVQLAWLKDDLAGRSASTPIVVFTHIPLWTVYADWGWGTDDGLQALTLLKRFGSVTVLNGHIHQIVQKVEGNMTFHTARSIGFPQPAPGTAPGPGPMTVPAEQLRSLLGIASVEVRTGDKLLAITDTPLAG